jgi:ribonuclease Z
MKRGRSNKVKILFLGVGSPLSQRYYNTSILINDSVLLDAPPGIDKEIVRRGLLLDNINYVFITHFHCDHILGLPQFLLNISAQKRAKPLYVIGPNGIEEVTKSLLELTFKDYEKDIIEWSKIAFIPISEKKIRRKIGKLTYEAYRLSHGNQVNYGYIIHLGGKTIGYTGDTGPCEGLEILIQKSDIVIIDVTFRKTTETHLGIDYVRNKSAIYRDKVFFGVHRGRELDGILIENAEGMIFPSDGDIYEL